MRSETITRNTHHTSHTTTYRMAYGFAIVMITTMFKFNI